MPWDLSGRMGGPDAVDKRPKLGGFPGRVKAPAGSGAGLFGGTEKAQRPGERSGLEGGVLE